MLSRKHLKPFLITWNATYIALTAFLFEAMTGRHMTSPVTGSFVFAAVFYVLWLTARFYWRKHDVDISPYVREAVAWVSAQFKQGEKA